MHFVPPESGMILVFLGRERDLLQTSFGRFHQHFHLSFGFFELGVAKTADFDPFLRCSTTV
jgi:hypothetical protein